MWWWAVAVIVAGTAGGLELGFMIDQMRRPTRRHASGWVFLAALLAIACVLTSYSVWG